MSQDALHAARALYGDTVTTFELLSVGDKFQFATGEQSPLTQFRKTSSRSYVDMRGRMFQTGKGSAVRKLAE